MTKSGKWFVALMILGCGMHGMAQHSDMHDVVASAGSSYSSEVFSLDWTLGEVVISTISSGSLLLTQGFHQPGLTVTSVHQLPDELGTITAYPVPATDDVTLSIDLDDPHMIQVALRDLAGKIISIREVAPGTAKETISVASLAAGMYFLHVTIDQKYTQTLRIQKIY